MRLRTRSRRKRKERVRGSVNKAVDVLILRHDRVSFTLSLFLFIAPPPPSALSFSFLREMERDEPRGPEEGEMVIIKSCNQLANLSSSVLIKSGPLGSLSLSLISFSFFSLTLSLFLSVFLHAYVSPHHLPTHAKLFSSFRTLRLRWRRQFFIRDPELSLPLQAIFGIFH